MYIYIYTQIHQCMYNINSSTNTHKTVYIHTYIHTFIYLFTYLLQYTYTHTHTHTPIYIYIYILIWAWAYSAIYMICTILAHHIYGNIHISTAMVAHFFTAHSCASKITADVSKKNNYPQKKHKSARGGSWKAWCIQEIYTADVRQKTRLPTDYRRHPLHTHIHIHIHIHILTYTYLCSNFMELSRVSRVCSMFCFSILRTFFEPQVFA